MYPINQGARSANYAWWKSDHPGEDMISTAAKIARDQSYWRERLLWNARLHGGMEILALTPTGYSRPKSLQVQIGAAVGLNVIENCCASAQAEICQNKPRATFSTNGADYDKRIEAEKLDQFCEAQFHHVGLYETAPRVFLDSCIFGTGILKIYEEDSEVKIERVFPWEILIDMADGLYGQPRCLYQMKYVDRAVLKELYPDHADAIEKATRCPLGSDGFLADTTSDLVQVIEGWRLPSKKKSGDGKHVIALDGITLLDEEWDRLDFPFAFLRWEERPFGFWGKGLAEQLEGIQTEINRLLLKIQRAFARLGITRVYIERGSKVNPSHMRAHDGDIVEYTGQKPVTEAPPSINPEIFSHLWQLESKAYQITGISQLSAQSQKPAGLDSGEALRVFQDAESKRFIIVGRRYEEFFIDVARKMVSAAKDIGAGYKVRLATEGGYVELDISEIDLDSDDCVIKPFPTAQLPSTPAAKQQRIQEWVNAGMIGKEEFFELLDWPDTKQFLDEMPAVASKRAILRKLTDIAKHGKPWVPDSFIDVKIAKALAVPFLLNAENENCPEERCDMLRDTITRLVDMETAANPPAPAPGDAGAPPPGSPIGPQGEMPADIGASMGGGSPPQ